MKECSTTKDLLTENNKLRKGMNQEQIQQLQEETGAMKSEREELKGKIDSAVSMLDKVDLDDVLDSIVEEVVEETDETD